jgi:hypothetical protein
LFKREERKGKAKKMVVYTAIFSCVFLLPFPPLRGYNLEKSAEKALTAFTPYRSLRLLFAFFARL